MNKLSRVLATATLALVTAVPAAAVATAAPANATPGNATQAGASERAAKPKALKLTKAKPGTHYGLAGNTITAKVRGKGKVKFLVDGSMVKKAKIKKGKAKYTLPADLVPGTYKVKAKYKKSKATIKTVVWDSALNVNLAAFEISASTPSYDLPELGGTVKYKGKTATTGYVDMYLNGNVKGGSSSTDYCCMSSVAADGTFSFYSFLSDAQKRGVGVWTYRAFYTETSSFADYIYSQPITVTVTP